MLLIVVYIAKIVFSFLFLGDIHKDQIIHQSPLKVSQDNCNTLSVIYPYWINDKLMPYLAKFNFGCIRVRGTLLSPVPQEDSLAEL